MTNRYKRFSLIITSLLFLINNILALHSVGCGYFLKGSEATYFNLTYGYKFNSNLNTKLDIAFINNDATADNSIGVNGGYRYNFDKRL